MHTHTAVKTHRMGQTAAVRLVLAWHGDHYPIDSYRQCRHYRQARCRLGNSMVQAVQHVMTKQQAGRQARQSPY